MRECEGAISLAHLVPACMPVIKQETATTRAVKVWSDDAVAALKECFQTTYRDLFLENIG